MKNNFQRICLVHYHEIGLKGKNRIYFERKLEQNVKDIVAKNLDKGFEIKRISGRILLLFDASVNADESSKIYDIVSKIPGCARVSVGYKCNQDVDSMIEAGCLVMKDAFKAGDVESFKLNARRNHTNFELDSMQLNQLVGGKISDAYPQVKVQMKNPSLEIRLEVIQAGAYVYGLTKPGVGGLPVGVSGKLVGMLSSGIDSPVAL